MGETLVKKSSRMSGVMAPTYTVTGGGHILNHQTFQVSKMEVPTYISCMDTAYVREFPHPQK